MKNFFNKIIVGDALKILPQITESSVDIVLTDPPYFLDKLDNCWDPKKVHNGKNQKVVNSLPAGMKFDREQGKNFYRWYLQIAEELFRILKPGGFFFSFSSPRLYHRMASAVDDAGFNIRDCFLWLYTQNQAKAMSLNHFIDRENFSVAEKAGLKRKLDGWKTPQLKSCFEPIMFAQKPTDGTFLDNIKKYNIGLVNTAQTTESGMFPANVMATESINSTIDRFFLVSKPTKQEKGLTNGHLTVKPLTLCEHLLGLTALNKKAVVLDPFLGSGTTALAAKNLGLNFIGVEINKEYAEIATKRLEQANENHTFNRERVSQVDLFTSLVDRI